MSSEEDDVLSVSDEMCTSDAEPEDIDINVYSSDSSARNSYKLYDNICDTFGAPQRPILPELPKELELRPTTAISAGNSAGGGPNHPQTFITVCARTDLKLGTIFGPYQGKIRKDPITTTFNWKVTDRSATFTAWLELSDFNAIQWITCIKKANSSHECNAILLLFRGQLYIELTRELNKGSELQLISTEVLLIHEDPNGKRDKTEGSLLNSQSNFSPSLEALHSSSSNTSSKLREQQNNSREPVCSSSLSDSVIRCSLCDHQFDDQLRLNEHLLFSHCNEDSGGADREYKCNQCPKIFNWKSNLIRHQVAHDESRRYTCENCKKVFTDPSNLQRHIRSQHIGARSHACPDCGKTFATSSGLKQHTHIHSSVKPFRCEVCFKAYTQFSNLCRHKRMHANCRLQIKCNKCGQAFSTVTSLSKHKRFCEGTPANQSAQQLSPAQRNVGHISNLSLSPNLSSPDSSTARKDISSLADLTSPLAGQTSNPFLSAFHSRPGFPFYSPFFGPTFPTLFPAPSIAGAAISPGTSAVPTLNTNSLNSDNSFLSAHKQFNREEIKSEPIEKSLENKTELQLKTNTKQEEINKKVSHSDESLATDLSDRSDLDEDTEDEEVAITGDSDSEVEDTPVFKSKDKLVSEDEEEVEEKGENLIKTENDSEATIMSTNRESSPKQGAVCPVQMISSNGYIRPLSLMVDHLHSDLPFDLSRNNSNKSQRRLLEDSPEFKSKVREEYSGEEPLDLTVKQRPVKESPRNGSNGSPHSASAAMVSNYEEMLVRHRAMLLSEGAHMRAIEEKSRSHSPAGHLFNHNNHHKLDSHFPQRPASPASKMMAYPRPIHPLLLESMYRMQMEGQHKSNSPAFPMFNNEHHNRINTSAAAFPAFPAARYPPMLSPALLGNQAAAQATFDFMRAHMSDKIKAQTPTELMSPQMIKAKERYTCKFCGKVFPRSANLTRHLRTHTGEQPYKCKYCERSFSISSNLQRHVRNIHNKEKPFKCPLCDRCFGQQTNLDRHLKKHESDGPTILDGGKMDKSNASDDQYFNDIRNFMGKVTDRPLVDRQQAFRALIESPALSNGNKPKVMSSPKTNGNNNDDNETIADEESDMESESMTTNTTGADGTPSKKTRGLHSDTSSVLEDEDVVMSEDAEDDVVDSATDEENNGMPSENGNNRSSPPPSQSPPVGVRTRAKELSSVVACLSKKAQQKLNGINGCGASADEDKPNAETALPLTTTGH